jgi:hypothetical protein
MHSMGGMSGSAQQSEEPASKELESVMTASGRTPDGEPTEKARLSVNLNPDAARALAEITRRRSISITEAVRRAIAVYDYIDRLDPERQRVQVVEGDQVRELHLVH